MLLTARVSGLPSDPASTKKLLPVTRCKFKIQREGEGPDPSPSPFILSALRAASETYTETVAEAAPQFLQQGSSFSFLPNQVKVIEHESTAQST